MSNEYFKLMGDWPMTRPHLIYSSADMDVVRTELEDLEDHSEMLAEALMSAMEELEDEKAYVRALSEERYGI